MGLTGHSAGGNGESEWMSERGEGENTLLLVLVVVFKVN
jgi:hypothetical protein